MSEANGIRLEIKIDGKGNPISHSNFIRLCPLIQDLYICFVVDSGFIPEDELTLRIICGKYSLELIGKSGYGYRSGLVKLETGTHCYYLLNNSQPCKEGYIQIPPILKFHDGHQISPGSIILQTVVSKWMGKVDEWDSHLQATSQAGYNMIHFTPLQERGISNSPYSLTDHLTLSFDLFDPQIDPNERLVILQKKLDWMYKELNLFSMIDVVWNHIACNSEHLKLYPNIGYNLENSPHLKIAFDLDECILEFSSNYEFYGKIPLNPNSETEVHEIIKIFKEQALPKASLWEYFVLDVQKELKTFRELFDSGASTTFHVLNGIDDCVYNDRSYNRHSLKIDAFKIVSMYRDEIRMYRELDDDQQKKVLLERCLQDFNGKLDAFNLPLYKEYDAKVDQIIRNITNRVIYERISEHGPKLGNISKDQPLVSTYFTRYIDNKGIKRAVANNGWIWNADPLVNFAEKESDAYFTRDVIIWGDCVKLRYGKSKEDNPWLWEYMTRYTQTMANIFNAFRIDNCHSTPIHVAEYLLNKAREVRDDLYVVAELFTGSQEKDMMFVEKLGLNSLIREAMVAWSPTELSRTAFNYGGCSLDNPFRKPEDIRMINVESSLSNENLISSSVHALFMDCTHDNEMPSQKRTPEDSLSNAAIVSLSYCAIGSTRGYDDIVPKHLNIVGETSLYPIPSFNYGLWQVRKQLNIIHEKIIDEDMTHEKINCDGDLVIIERTNPSTNRGILAIVRTAFSYSQFTQVYSPISNKGYEFKALLAASIRTTDAIQNVEGRIATIPILVELEISQVCNGLAIVTNTPNGGVIELQDFTPGSVLILERSPQFSTPNFSLSSKFSTELLGKLEELDLYDINVLLYRCAAEEDSEERKIGTYNWPGYGQLPYSGIQGFKLLVERARDSFSIEESLKAHIQQGDWALNYVCDRLRGRKTFPRLDVIGEFLLGVVNQIAQCPPDLKPQLFVQFIETIYRLTCERALKFFPAQIGENELLSSLTLTSVQLVGIVDSTGLHPTILGPSMSAGIPHFSSHHMRCWGRDVFISLPGLLLATGRYHDAFLHLIGFASCLYEGLIPNLLDSARYPRYNARDATWWFLRALQKYCKVAHEGRKILEEQVKLRFPDNIYINHDHPTSFTKTKRLADIVQEIMECHARGIHFREWNAGAGLDSVMQDDGFNIAIQLDLETGFIFGGNDKNCGTWMDKMGESSMACNRGIPATPRDGAAIELTALLACTLDWLIEENPTGKTYVTLEDGNELSYFSWREKIQKNFEDCYYISRNGGVDDDYIQQVGFYKDCFRSSRRKDDYKLRPNMIVAINVAPSLFTKFERIESSLKMAELFLIGDLGMRTLSPLDSDYRPYYHNGVDSTDYSTARGFNYHQGPEWLWLIGPYLNVWKRVNFPDDKNPGYKESNMLIKLLSKYLDKLKSSDYFGLPELTNKDGAFCEDSCATQAWSTATLLEVLLLE